MNSIATMPADEFDKTVLPVVCDQVMRGGKEFGARMFLFATFAIVQGFRHGFRTNDYLLLLCGSVVSFCALFGMLRASNELVAGRPIHPVYGLFVGVLIGQVVPYLFVMYTFCYRGLYYAYLLCHSFHWSRLLSCIFFVTCSWTALHAMMIIQEANKILRRRVGPHPFGGAKGEHA